MLYVVIFEEQGKPYLSSKIFTEIGEARKYAASIAPDRNAAIYRRLENQP